MACLEPVHATPGLIVVTFTVQEFMCNLSNNMHGAMYQWLTDDITSMALLSVDRKTRLSVSVHMAYVLTSATEFLCFLALLRLATKFCLCLFLSRMEYMSTAPLGSRVYLEAKAEKIGQTLGFSKAHFYGEDGNLLAIGTHTKFMTPGSFSSGEKMAKL